MAVRPPFVTTPYVVGRDGRVEPRLPGEGPCRDRDGCPCRLALDHWRLRKTGPCFALAVVRCAAHELGFTLYPPGHVPYGRRAIAPVAPDGAPVCPADCSDDASAVSFEGTYFEAALDAARGQAWDRHCPGGSDRWWQTQRRQLARGMRWLGAEPAQAVEIREVLAAALRTPDLLLID